MHKNHFEAVVINVGKFRFGIGFLFSRVIFDFFIMMASFSVNQYVIWLWKKRIEDCSHDWKIRTASTKKSGFIFLNIDSYCSIWSRKMFCFVETESIHEKKAIYMKFFDENWRKFSFIRARYDEDWVNGLTFVQNTILCFIDSVNLTHMQRYMWHWQRATVWKSAWHWHILESPQIRRKTNKNKFDANKLEKTRLKTEKIKSLSAEKWILTGNVTRLWLSNIMRRLLGWFLTSFK